MFGVQTLSVHICIYICIRIVHHMVRETENGIAKWFGQKCQKPTKNFVKMCDGIFNQCKGTT